MLEQLEKNGKIQEFAPYTVSTWTFRKDLALVFLPGEVGVDYAVRLKTELDYTRLWRNGWCNRLVYRLQRLGGAWWRRQAGKARRRGGGFRFQPDAQAPKPLLGPPRDPAAN